MEWLSVKPNVLWALGGIFIMLVIASLAIFVQRRLSPHKDYTELRQRVQSWWLMVCVFSVAIALSRNVSLIFFAFVSFLALKEYLSLIPTRRADRRVLFWAYLTIPLQYVWIAKNWYGMFIIFVPVYAFLFLPMRMVIIGETKDFLRAVGTLHWGV